MEPAPVKLDQEVQKPQEEVKKAPTPVQSPAPSPVSSPAPTNNIVKETKKEVEPEPKKEEANSFAFKLEQLQQMGFVDKERNIALLMKNHLDMVRTVKDLLE